MQQPSPPDFATTFLYMLSNWQKLQDDMANANTMMLNTRQKLHDDMANVLGLMKQVFCHPHMATMPFFTNPPVQTGK
jgi:hypothetical protein